MTGRHFPIIAGLQAATLAVIVVFGWSPVDRQTWMIENALVVIGAAAVWLTRRSFYWSARSWAMLLVFVCLHQVGTHYTYPQVPYNQAFVRWMDIDPDRFFDAQRNHYDRFVHLCYGVLTALPFREIILRKCQLNGAWASLMAWSMVLSTSMLYELMEWVGGEYWGEGGSAVIGAQGDVWDAQKDMALAAVGALTVLACRGRGIRRLQP
ncbi:Inner membrane protein YjdF [Pseudomonas fluorescens]|uniref:DUF2238 domain-containing protein n=1 Tax=Pseudomonas fluorescens TaxID=294 RepID=UPI0012531A81|nr:DUF2238 domain-containing protein [Pseudomonas fluorescens]CAG8865713.1 Inner membrane protein YjdF [Pseudomonas fluorescens]VVP87665.1 Inner membrane protein YjdF [Pseudomonas fluorescens]